MIARFWRRRAAKRQIRLALEAMALELERELDAHFAAERVLAGGQVVAVE